MCIFYIGIWNEHFNYRRGDKNYKTGKDINGCLNRYIMKLRHESNISISVSKDEKAKKILRKIENFYKNFLLEKEN